MRWRLWVYRIVAMTLIPALFLLAVELGLRLVGFGYPTDFFVEIDGREVVTTNQKFGWQFFPPAIARTPALCELPAAKEPDTFRIFVLGGSAAMGTPESAFGFARYLDVMLSDSFPDMKFEVVNAAMTAINSHVVLTIARQCARRQPDLMIVYMGNNEVVGPYGPGTVFAGFSSRITAIRGSMRLKRSKLGQLMSSLRPASTHSQWRGMEMFLEQTITADDPSMESVYAHFRTNLDEICDSATAAGARVIVCTVATNLKDCPPFAALHRDNISETDREQWQAHYDTGVTVASDGNHAEAVTAFLRAMALDDRRPDVHFRLGQAYLALGQAREAREHLVLARDLDALRFRADTEINRIIREVSGERECDGIHLVDVERVFATSDRTPHRLPGQELFYEHVHMNLDGTYLLAKTVFEQTVAILADRPPRVAARGVDAPSQERCLRLLPLTSPDRLRMVKAMTKLVARPPFTNQIDHDRRFALAKEQTAELQERSASSQTLSVARQRYDEALGGSTRHVSVTANHARLLRRCGDYAASADLWRELIDRLPGTAYLHTQLALTLQSMGDLNGAIAAFREGMNLDSSKAAVQHSNIGRVHLARGDITAAAQEFRRALRLDKQSVRALNGLGVVLRRQGRPADAMAQFEQALAVEPNDGPSHHNMGVALSEQGDLEAALSHYRRAMEHDPGDVDRLHSLASVLIRLGRPREAIVHYRRARRLGPDRPDTHSALANALAANGQRQEAIELYRVALQVDPDFVEAGHNLAMTLGQLGRTDEAIEQHERVLQGHPDSVPTLVSLAGALATHRDPGRRDSDRAVRMALRACELTQYRDARPLDVLSVAYAMAGDLDNARKTAEQALQRARETGRETLVQRIEGRLRRLNK